MLRTTDTGNDIPLSWESLNNLYQEVGIAESSGKHRVNQRRDVLRYMPKDKVGAEIGVFTGLFSSILAEVCKPKKLFLVDPWDKLHGTHYPNWGEYTNNTRVPTAGAEMAATLRAREMTCNCKVVKSFSLDWLRTLEPNSLDWVYLDANHKYSSVLNDLNNIYKAIAEDGIISGDDCWINESGIGGEVYRAT